MRADAPMRPAARARGAAIRAGDGVRNTALWLASCDVRTGFLVIMINMDIMECARLQGMHPQTASQWLCEGRLPIPAVRVDPRPALASSDAVIAGARDVIGLCAGVSCHGQRVGLDRQVAFLTAQTAQCGGAVARAGAEVGRG